MSILTPNFTKFPDGQVHVKVNAAGVQGAHVKIACQPHSSDDLFGIALYAEALRHKGVASLDWICPLIPWSRMDRRMSENEPHSMKVMAKFINELEFDCVYTATPHSDVCEALIDNLTILDPFPAFISRLVAERKLDPENLILVAPDMGAVKRTQKIAQMFPKEPSIAILSKKREDGEVKLGVAQAPDVYKDTAILVVDDLLDGGATFVNAVPVLKQVYGDRPRHLMIAHGLFSNFRNLLLLQSEYETISFLDHSFMPQEVDLNVPQPALVPHRTFPWISAQI